MWLLKDTGSWQATLTSLIYGFPGCLVIAILAHRRWGKIMDVRLKIAHITSVHISLERTLLYGHT